MSCNEIYFINSYFQSATYDCIHSMHSRNGPLSNDYWPVTFISVWGLPRADQVMCLLRRCRDTFMDIPWSTSVIEDKINLVNDTPLWSQVTNLVCLHRIKVSHRGAYKFYINFFVSLTYQYQFYNFLNPSISVFLLKFEHWLDCPLPDSESQGRRGAIADRYGLCSRGFA